MKLLGKGNTAEVFEYAAGKVCKLFYGEYPQEYIELEYENAKEMYACGIRAPRPFQLLVMENRRGIIYEKMDGTTLLDLMLMQAGKYEEYLDLLVKLHRDIMGHHSNDLMSYKDYLTTMVRNKLTDCEAILMKIHSLPDGDCILHGDFHPGNILIEEDGTPVVIDFMNVCRGPALYDIARSYFLLRQANAELADEYLQKISVDICDIKDFLDVIEICRKYER